MRFHRPQSLALRGLHLLVLCGFGLAQPLFDLLGKTPEFFVVRGSTSWDVVVAGIGLAVIPAAALLVLEALAGIVHPRAQSAVHLGFVAALAALIALQALRRLGDVPAWPLLGAAITLGALAAAAYARFPPLRTVITALAPAPLIFFVLFLVNSPVEELRHQSDTDAESLPIVDSRTPVVMILFDELPVTSLRNAAGDVDAERFPNFGALAGNATWFRNATTVHEHTTSAVPSILTGENPKTDALPLVADHPRNVFTYLARSHRMHVLEPVTQLCPSEVCERRLAPFAERMQSLVSDLRVVYLHVTLPDTLADDLPPIDETWEDFGGSEDSGADGVPLAKGESALPADADVGHQLWHDKGFEFEQWVDEIGSDTARRPSFHFIHTLLPHRPWRYLPNGKRYRNAAARGLDKDVWQPDQWITTQAYQHHLLQVGFSDRLLGMALDRLHETALYDRSLIIVAADHGASFRVGGGRRRVDQNNLADIAAVPLFVKRPGQREGEIVDRHVRTTDILPTIADVLGTQLPRPVDGHSLFDRAAPDRSTVTVQSTAGHSVSAQAEEIATGGAATLARQVGIFGSGDWQSVYAVGPHKQLLGRSLQAVRVVATSAMSATLDHEESLRDLDLDSAPSPSHLTGQVAGDGSEQPLDLAIAVNGRIAAVTRAVRIGGGTRFSAMAPESAFRPGRNSVEIFAVRPSGGRLQLERLHGGGFDARLETAAGETVIRLDAARQFTVVPGALQGEVERWSYQPATLVLVGWAADVTDRALADRVLVFLDGRLVYSTASSFRRRDVAEDYGTPETIGFVSELPLSLVGRGDSELRFFAVRGETASELSYADGFPWR